MFEAKAAVMEALEIWELQQKHQENIRRTSVFFIFWKVYNEEVIKHAEVHQ